MGEALDRLEVKLAAVVVPPHYRYGRDGRYTVKGYIRHDPRNFKPRAQVARVRKPPATPASVVDKVRNDEERNEVIAQRAKLAGQMTKQYLRAEDRHLQKLLDRSKVFVHMDWDGFQSFLFEGQYKTWLQGAGTHGGRSYKRRDRRRAEEALFGPGAAPIYGALKENPESLGFGVVLGHYGRVALELKPEVKNRSSFTATDSLDKTMDVAYDPRRKRGWRVSVNPKIAPQPMKGGEPSLAFPYEDQMDGTLEEGGRWPRDARRLKSVDDAEGIAYFEAQIHGGIKLSDVKTVHFYEGEVEDYLEDIDELPSYWSSEEKVLEKQLRKHGIKLMHHYLPKPLDIVKGIRKRYPRTM